MHADRAATALLPHLIVDTVVLVEHRAQTERDRTAEHRVQPWPRRRSWSKTPPAGWINALLEKLVGRASDVNRRYQTISRLICCPIDSGLPNASAMNSDAIVR